MDRNYIASELVKTARELLASKEAVESKKVLGRAGDSFENDKIRAHQFMSSIQVWDLTNAGKRGKKVEKLTIMETPSSERDMLDNHFRGIKMAASGGFDAIVSLFKDIQYDYPDDLKLYFDTERGVDVAPAGFRPITIKTKDLFLKADYKDFYIKDLTDPYNEPSCIPAISGGKKDIKVFYRWVKDNESKIRRMSFREVTREMGKNGIEYHEYCAMD